MKRVILITSAVLIFSFCAVACGGGSSGGGSGNAFRTNAVTIEGTLRSASATSRVLAPGEGGIPGVEVSALGNTSLTDENGNFRLFADGAAFPGGAVEFAFLGAGIDEKVPLEGVPGGPGALAFVNFVLEDNGRLSGESTDAEGTVLGTTPFTGGRLGCTSTGDFQDGGFGALWKPVAESTGTAVILMPARYRNSSVSVHDANGAVVDGPLRRNCCQHNGGREHVYLRRTARSLAGEALPLTVRFAFPDGEVDCRSVPNPNQRYD